MSTYEWGSWLPRPYCPDGSPSQLRETVPSGDSRLDFLQLVREDVLLLKKSRWLDIKSFFSYDAVVTGQLGQRTLNRAADKCIPGQRAS